jgi:hypothetical protein
MLDRTPMFDRNSTRTIWHSARFVPHFFLMLVSGLVGLMIAGIMILFSQSSTVVASNASCSVENTYTSSHGIFVRMNCDGHEIRTDNSDLVFDIVSKHLATVFCERIYADDSVRGCKTRE